MKSILLTFTLIMSYLTGIAQETKPQFDIDHIIILTEKDAPESKLFEEKGFTIANRVMSIRELCQEG